MPTGLLYQTSAFSMRESHMNSAAAQRHGNHRRDSSPRAGLHCRLFRRNGGRGLRRITGQVLGLSAVADLEPYLHRLLEVLLFPANLDTFTEEVRPLKLGERGHRLLESAAVTDLPRQ